jgi:hypothetical protein
MANRATTVLRSFIAETLCGAVRESVVRPDESLTNAQYAARLELASIQQMDVDDAEVYASFVASGVCPWDDDRMAELAGRFDLTDEYVDAIRAAVDAPSKAARKRLARAADAAGDPLWLKAQTRDLGEAALHGAGRDYLRKEAVKDVIQAALTDRVASGEVSDQAALDGFFATVDMAVRALKMVPFDAWRTASARSTTNANAGVVARPRARRV